MEQLTFLADTRRGKILTFPGPKSRPDRSDMPTAEGDLRQGASTIGEAPAPVRRLSDRQVDHRRRMLLHLTSTSASHTRR
jgi:hypothetical protein